MQTIESTRTELVGKSETQSSVQGQEMAIWFNWAADRKKLARKETSELIIGEPKSAKLKLKKKSLQGSPFVLLLHKIWLTELKLPWSQDS